MRITKAEVEQQAAERLAAHWKAQHDALRFCLISRLAANELQVISVEERQSSPNEIVQTTIQLISDPELLLVPQQTYRDGPPSKRAATKTRQPKGK